MRFSKEDKLNMYKLKKQGYSYSYIENLYGIKTENLRYLIKVIDKHGIKWLYRPYKKWTTEEKLLAINRVLSFNESRRSVALDFGLSNTGMLSSWIKNFKKNDYNVVEKSVGRTRLNSTMKNKKNNIDSKDKKIKDLEKQLLYAKAEVAYLKALRELDEKDEKKQE